jgi:hypothetical protein
VTERYTTHGTLPRRQAWTRFKWLLFAVVLFASCNPLRGCPESEFTLSPDSRLPKWFSLPPGKSRKDVDVTLTYYSAALLDIDDVVITLVDTRGWSLATATGRVCWHPAMHEKTNHLGGFDPDSYPHYVIVTANGVTEVIEHSHGPVFRVTDDPILVSQAKDSLSRGECRQNP